jgi:hypothetical protein
MSSACHLAHQLSTSICTYNVSFGCSYPANEHGLSTWVARGCRAWLRCGEAGLVRCGDWRGWTKQSRCACKLPVWEEMDALRKQLGSKQPLLASHTFSAAARRAGLHVPRALPPNRSNALPAERLRRAKCGTVARFKGVLTLAAAALLPGARAAQSAADKQERARAKQQGSSSTGRASPPPSSNATTAPWACSCGVRPSIKCRGPLLGPRAKLFGRGKAPGCGGARKACLEQQGQCFGVHRSSIGCRVITCLNSPIEHGFGHCIQYLGEHLGHGR